MFLNRRIRAEDDGWLASVWQAIHARDVEKAQVPVGATPSALANILSLSWVAVLFETALWLFLYLRPTPFGRPFALDPSHYLFHAIYYGAWAHAVLACPFLAWVWFRPRANRVALGLQLLLTTLVMIVGSVDRECQRFMGMHATLPWLQTYAAIDRTPEVVLDSLASDRGGSWSSLAGVALCLAYPFAALYVASRLRFDWLGRGRAWSLAVVLVALPTVLWNVVPGGTLRQAKVRPALLTVLRELGRDEPAPPNARETQRAVAAYQAAQNVLDPRGVWTFVDPKYPLRKRYVGPRDTQPARRPNFIVVQLETFRAKDMRSTNPSFSSQATTPFLDGLANDERSALFTRYYASGVPTVYAFMSIHASLLSHPRKSIPVEATTVHIEAFPQQLREAGYHTLHFTGSDPDWDSQRVWLDRWYDEVHFDPSHHERDRAVFRAASARIREVAQKDQPFLAYLVSITNHAPFRNPDHAFDLGAHENAFEALHDTMRYTDDVVGELYASLEHEPWFEDTIWIITGDHGYDLGDRGEACGHNNLRHETTWVPLIIHGKDPRLPRGRVACVGSHLDLAPTILELASVYSDNSYMGSSLLARDCEKSEVVVLRGGNYSYESAAFSLFHPEHGQAIVYAGDDLTQARELARPPQTVVERASRLARAYETTLVHAIDHDRVAPRISDHEHLAELAP